MTWILGIDTSHHVAVGLARDGEPVVSEVVADTRAHGEALTPLIQRLCARVWRILKSLRWLWKLRLVRLLVMGRIPTLRRRMGSRRSLRRRSICPR